MNILSTLFGGPTPPAPVAAGAATPVTPGNLPDGSAAPAAATPGTDANGMVPATVVTPETPDSPLDQFKDMWEPVTTPEGQVTAPAQLDPAKLQEIISKADFTQTLSSENLSLIAAGGEGAQAAFIDSLNTVARQVLMQSTMANNKMTEQAVATALASQTATLPELIRSQTTSNNLQKANPLFSNPAVKPVIEAVQAQLAIKNPTATADQLTEMAQNFVSVMGESFAPKPVTSATEQASQNVDWDKFLTGG